MTDEPPLRRRAAHRRAGDEPYPTPAPEPEATVSPDPAAPGPVPLLTPHEGVPEPIETADALAEVVARFAAGTGPVAIDAERASGYRYSQRAYLVQLRRAGAGTVLIDPLPLADLATLDAAIGPAEWVLHAASQDLPCLAEIGLRPRRLFDTELAARLAGFERVGLAALTEQLLGYTLQKHHSAADWSTRPLPESWLNYAALDVEMLTELRDALDAELERQGKEKWAAEEFAALVASASRPPRPRVDPWRRTSGIHRVRGARAQARVRSLWYARDTIAARRDSAPGRVLPDAAIIAAAELDPRDERTLLTLPGFGGRSVRRLARTWLEALAEARQLADDALPVSPVVEGPPPPHRWAERDPVAAARLARCRAVVTRIATEHNLPPENLISPDSVRRLAWTPPAEIRTDSVAETLRGFGAREWQLGLIADELAAALPAAD
ncbi:ribonuclease D [Plantactinospora sp. KBS50]|uniref:ribonuclease D n=1 Tax=Plantactinospora sp. KBS50 TaxID=2024580 RepID=UPI000BAAD5C7|nr:ribonuclease D [Plantactinospora sp. KBS50]ASW54198.1 ribonuclease D [Plantactinospora sp. KBS50]